MSAIDASLPHPNPDVVFCEVEGGAVLLHAKDEIYFGLNEVGCAIWGLLPPVSADWPTLVAGLGHRWPEVRADVLRADAEELLAALRREGLVVSTATDA
jgi:hypothetical protein